MEESIEVFEAPTLNEAWSLLKSKFGDQAIIISQGKVLRGGFLGFFAKEVYQIRAARETGSVKRSRPGILNRSDSKLDLSDIYQLKSPSQTASTLISKNRRNNGIEKSPGVLNISTAPRLPLAEKKSSDSGVTENMIEQVLKVVVDLQSQVAEMKQRSSSVDGFVPVDSTSFSSQWTGNLKRVYDLLIRQDFLPRYANSLTEKLSRHSEDIVSCWEDLKYELTGELSSILKVTGSLVTPLEAEQTRQKVLMFFGPTGVGKTTTISKLASNSLFCLQRKVGIGSIDTYRIAAIEQLKQVASIISVPVEVAYKPDQLPQILETFSDRDLILIDTAGRNQKSSLEMLDLKEYVEIIGADYDLDICLVLSATTQYSCMESIVENFSKLKFNRLIFTKLDETETLGNIFNIALKFDCPIAYLTNGQAVPDDIRVASTLDLARKITESE